MAVGLLHMNTDLQTSEVSLEYQVLGELKELGFRIAQPEGLDSPAFPDTFSPSAFHDLVRRSALNIPEITTRWAGSDWVFRHVDLDKIGFSSVHLSTFKMLVFLEVGPHSDAHRSRERTIQIVLQLLKHSLNLDADQLYITYFSRHIDLPSGLCNEAEIPILWRRAGVPPENLIPIPGTANLTNVVRTEEPAGPRCEIFLRDVYGTFFEIATVVFECLKVIKTHPLAFKLSGAAVCGAAFGLERCEMVSQDAKDIFQLPEVYNALGIIESDLHPHLAVIGSNYIRRIIDGVRTAIVIVQNTRRPYSRIRKDRVREIRNSVVRAARILGYEDVPLLVERVTETLQAFGRFNVDSLVGPVRSLFWGE